MKRTPYITGIAAAIFSISSHAAVMSPNGTTLQGILNDNTGTGTETDGSETFGNAGIDVYADQHSGSIWHKSDSGASASFSVSLIDGDYTLGIYSKSNPTLQFFLEPTGSGSATFDILNGTTLYINGVGKSQSFGSAFGFFVDTEGDSDTNDRVYTEMSMNSDIDLATAYLLADGTNVKSASFVDDFGDTVVRKETTVGNDDWILAFELDDDGNYADAVFHVNNIAVSAPATLALMGLGLLGMVRMQKRKKA